MKNLLIVLIVGAAVIFPQLASAASSFEGFDSIFSVDFEGISETGDFDFTGNVVFGFPPSSGTDITPGSGLMEYNITATGLGGLFEFTSEDNTFFPVFPQVNSDADGVVSGINTEIEFLDGLFVTIDNTFDVTSEATGLLASGVIAFSSPELVTEASPTSPNVIPTPTAAAGTIFLLGLVGLRRRPGQSVERH
ncbi:MAG: hypothetical protein AAGG38_10760 [Planctomycetota bacterium]